MNTNSIDFLFGIFPRDTGIPNPFQKNSFYRKEVTCKKDFQRYLALMSGSSRGTYVSVYDNNDKVIVDKFVFDLDSNDLGEAFAEVDILCSRLHDKNISYAVIFSGKKGFHVWGLLESMKLQRDIALYYLRNLHESFIGGLKTIDSSIIGDIRRMIRVPNSLNDGRYCTPLPFEFRKMSIEEILDYSKTQHSLHFFPGEPKTIQELVGNISVPQRSSRKEFKDEIKISSIPSMEILEELIRPCVIKEVQKPHPCVEARLSFVSEMMFASFRPKQILDIIRELNWDDFDVRYTEYQIKWIFGKKLKPYSNSKLKEAFGCEDTTYYWWG